MKKLFLCFVSYCFLLACNDGANQTPNAKVTDSSAVLQTQPTDTVTLPATLQQLDSPTVFHRFNNVRHPNLKKVPAWASFSPAELQAIATTKNLDSVRFFLGSFVDNIDGRKHLPTIMVQLKIKNVGDSLPGAAPTYNYQYYTTTGESICPPPYNNTGRIKLEYRPIN